MVIIMRYKDIKTPQELYIYIKKNIKYGFVSKFDNKIYRRSKLNNDKLYDSKIAYEYYLQTPKELLKSRCGICYDQVELIRSWLIEKNYEVFTYFSNFHNHVILIYKEDNNYNLFESALPKHNGIYKSKSIDDCLKIYSNMQFSSNKDVNEIILYPYDNVKFGSGFLEFMNYAKKRKREMIILKRDRID